MAGFKSKPPSLPTDSEAIDGRYLRRHIKGPWEQLTDTATQKDAVMIVMLLTALMTAILPMIFILTVPITLIYYAWASTRKYKLPFKAPMNWGGTDYGAPLPGRPGKYGKAQGILYFGRDEFSMEELWIENGDARRHGFFIGTTGSGKALPMDTPILTPAGWVMNGDLNPGDLICHPDGSNAEISSIHPQGSVTGVKLSFADGREAICSEDHLWHVSATSWCEGVADEDEITNPSPLPPEGRIMEAKDLGILFGLYGQDFEVFVPLARPHTGPASEGRLDRSAAIYAAKNGILTLDYMVSSIGTPEERLSFLVDYIFCRAPAMHPEENGLRIFDLPPEDAKAVKQIAWSLGGLATTYARGATTLDVLLRFEGLERLHPGAEGIGMPAGLAITAVDPLEDQIEMSCIKVDRDDGLYVMENHITTHNTELLLGVVSQTLMWSSGFLFIDGKGTTEFYARAWTLCKRFGREDDLRILNFTDAGGDPDAPAGGPMTQSNTLNPFSKGTPDQLMNLVVSLMGDAGQGNDMWKQRAESLVTGLMMALCELRDAGDLLLDVQAIRDYLALGKGFDKDKLGQRGPGARGGPKMTKIEDIPEEAWEEMRNRAGFIELYLRAMNKELSNTTYLALKAFFDSLPGFNLEKALNGDLQDAKASEQYGFLSMQLTKPLGSLADGYGHIFRTGLGEIDMDDVVLNRRILVVLLPALQKSSSEMQNCGKIVVTLAKMMMGNAAGSQVMGSKREIVEAKQTNAPSPYVVVLDEAGYYLVKGVDVMMAQARSLGFMIIVAGQDMQAMKQVDKQIAETAAANASILAVGKTVDGGETVEFVQKLIGKAKVSVSSGYSATPGMVNNKWYDKMDVTFEEVEKVKIQELQELGEGQFYLLFNGRLIRAATFYIGNEFAANFSVNKFLKVRGPTDKFPGLDQSVEETFIRDLLAATETLLNLKDEPPEDIDDDLALAMSVQRALLKKAGSKAGDSHVLRRAALTGLAAINQDTEARENDDEDDDAWGVDFDSDDDDTELSTLHAMLEDDLPDLNKPAEKKAKAAKEELPVDLPAAKKVAKVNEMLAEGIGLDELGYPQKFAESIQRSARGATPRDRHQGLISVLEYEHKARKEAVSAGAIEDPASDLMQKKRPRTVSAFYGTLSKQMDHMRNLLIEEQSTGELGNAIMSRSPATGPVPLPAENAGDRVRGTLDKLEQMVTSGKKDKAP